VELLEKPKNKLYAKFRSELNTMFNFHCYYDENDVEKEGICGSKSVKRKTLLPGSA
jgi:hypothetical protein